MAISGAARITAINLLQNAYAVAMPYHRLLFGDGLAMAEFNHEVMALCALKNDGATDVSNATTMNAKATIITNAATALKAVLTGLTGVSTHSYVVELGVALDVVVTQGTTLETG